jgi:outer membrane lipoprotein SlyB
LFTAFSFNQFSKINSFSLQVSQVNSMVRSFAVSLGSLAMAVTVIRGAIGSEVVSDVIFRSIGAMIAFAAIGAVAGWIVDTQIRESVRQRFQSRVDWYREGWEKLNSET